MTFQIKKPAIVPARGPALLQPVEKLNLAVQMLSRQTDDPMQSAVRLGELFDAGLLRYDASGLLVAGPALTGDAYTPPTFKNYLINGDHYLWQRGTSMVSAANSSRWLADRWVAACNSNAISSTQQVFPLGQRDVPGNPLYFQRISIDSVTADPTAYTVYFQRIENLRRFANKRVTISWYAKANAPREMSLEIIFNTGTGGSALPAIAAPNKKQLTTNWQRFEQTVDLPSMAGLTVNQIDSALLPHFWLAAGSDAGLQTRSAGLPNTTGYVDIACIQVEDGDTATDFEFLPSMVTQLQCQRYYYKLLNNTSSFMTVGMGAALTTVISRVSRAFPTSMRTPPSVTSSGTLQAYGNGAISTVSISASYPNPDGFDFDLAIPSAASGQPYVLGLTLNAFLVADSEM